MLNRVQKWVSALQDEWLASYEITKRMRMSWAHNHSMRSQPSGMTKLADPNLLNQGV